MMELTEDFFKLLQIALVVVGVLAIYFSYVSYNVIVETRSAEREALLIGNTLLSSDCLTYSDTKSLFSEDKLNDMQSDSTCLKKQYVYGNISIELQDKSNNWQINLGSSNLGGENKIYVAVRLNSGVVEPALMSVTV